MQLWAAPSRSNSTVTPLELLLPQGAEPELWLDFARAYLAQGLTGHYERVLVDATSDDAAQYFNENFPDRAKYARIQGLCR